MGDSTTSSKLLRLIEVTASVSNGTQATNCSTASQVPSHQRGYLSLWIGKCTMTKGN